MFMVKISSEKSDTAVYWYVVYIWADVLETFGKNGFIKKSKGVLALKI